MIVGALLTAVALLLLSLLPGPPAEAVAMTAWVERGHSLLSWTVALVALVVVLLTVGRLVYPVFGIDLSSEVIALVVSLTFGALHLAYLGFAVAAATLNWSTGAGVTGRAVGVGAAAAFVVGSFPWLTPDWWNCVVAVLVGVWGVFLASVTGTGNSGDATQTTSGVPGAPPQVGAPAASTWR